MKQSWLIGVILGLSGAACADLPDANKLQNLQQTLTSKLNEYKMLVNGAGRCLEVPPAQARNNGTRVHIWDCNGSEFQRWKHEGGRFKNAGGKCLDVVGDVKRNGNTLQLWDCNGAPNQQWSLSGGRLQNGGGKCLDIPGGDPNWNRNGMTVQTWDCNNAVNQKWSYQLK